MKKTLLALLLVLAGSTWAKTNLVNSIRVETNNENKGECTVVLRGNFSITRYQERSIKNPPKLVLDVHGAFNRLKKKVKVESDIVRQIRTSQFNNRPPTVRIVLDLKKAVTYEIKKDKALYIVLRDEALLAVAREESLKTATARAESLRVADSLAQAAVAESVALANAGFIAGLKDKGLLLPVGGGAATAVLVLVIILVVLGKRKKRQEEQEFENLMMADTGREPPAGGIPSGDEESDGGAPEERGDDGMGSKLDEIQSELEEVREQAAQIEKETGFEVDLVGGDDVEAAPEAETQEAPAVDEAPAAEEREQFDIDDFQKKFSGAVADGEEGAKDIDAQIREIEGNRDETPAPAAPESEEESGGDDDFDLDATIAELKEKISGSTEAARETTAEEPSDEETVPAEAPAESPSEPAAAADDTDTDEADELGSLLDSLGAPEADTAVAEPEVPAEEVMDFVSDEPATTEPGPVDITEEPVAIEESAGPDETAVSTEPETAEEPVPAEPAAPPAASLEPTAPAVTPAEVIRQQEDARRMEEKFRQYEEEENALSSRMQAYQQKIDGLKELLARREKRLEELIDFNDRIHADIQNIQGRLDASLSKLDQAKEEPDMPAAVPQTPAMDTEPAVPGGFDVVVDDTSGFEAAVEPDSVPEPEPQEEPAVSGPEPSVETEVNVPEPEPSAEPESVAPAAEPVASAPEPQQEDSAEPKFKKVFNLADQGLDSVAIAQQLGMGRGQVELFLKLREKGKMG